MGFFRWIMGIFFILLPAILVVVGATMAWDQKRKLTTYKSVEAKVDWAEIKVSSSRKSTSYKPVVGYHYVVSDRPYTCSKVAPIENSRSREWAQEVISKYRVGSTTTAYYDPENPSDAFLLHEWTFLPYLFVLFPMIFMTIGQSLLFGSNWARAAKPPAPPTIASPGWFSLNPRRSLWQRLRAWLVMMMLWYGIGALAIGHYFHYAWPPYGAAAWTLSAVYLALGLLPAWGWLYHFLLMRRTSDPIVMTSVLRFQLGQNFEVRLVHPMHRETVIESLKLGLVRDKHTKTKSGNKTRYNTVVDFEKWQTVLKDHQAQADEIIQQSASLTIPTDGPPSTFGDYPGYEWKIEVRAALRDSPDYRAEYMILVEDAGRAAS